MPTSVWMQAGALAPGDRFHFEGMEDVFVKLDGRRYRREKQQAHRLLDPSQKVIRIDHEPNLKSDLRFRNVPVGEEFFGILGHRMIKIANDGTLNAFNRTLCLRTTVGQDDLVYHEIAADSAVSRMAERLTSSAAERNAVSLTAASQEERQRMLEVRSWNDLLQALQRRVERLEGRFGYRFEP